MVGPVSRGRIGRVGLIVALSLGLGARAASAAEAEVTVRCAELSAEDAAEVEARVRASLLGAVSEPATVALSCEPDSALTQVSGSGRQVAERSERGAISAKEALLASAEAALAAWSAVPSEVPPSAPTATVAAPVPAVEPVPAPPPTPLPRTPPSASPARAIAASTWLWAGPRAELWSHGWGLGPQLGLEQRLNAAFLAIHGGYLFALPNSTQFSAHDLQFGAQIGWQPRPLFGFRGALGVGLSVFGVNPQVGVTAQNGTTRSTLACLSLELSRPVEFGAFALFPNAGFRAFTRRRSVFIDEQEVLALPALALEAGLSLALKVGG